MFDNDTTSVAADGTPAKTIHCSIVGGTAADIAEAINNTKVASVLMYGATSTDHYDETTAQTKSITYDVAADVDLVCLVTGDKTGEYPSNGDALIAANLVAYFADFRIAQTMDYGDLQGVVIYGSGTQIMGLSNVVVYIDTGPAPATGVVDIGASALQRLALASDDITVTVT
ncbi:MAG: hypothetical protein GY869_28550 [Planctomycetes bacterium]|nr:hypothetical protein [Planctomycetota bacterium]